MLTENNDMKVLKLFFDSPEKKFHIRQISRLTKLSPPGVLKIVKRLSDEGFLLSEKSKLVKNISAPRTDKFIQAKRMFNVYSLYDCGIIRFLREKYEEPEAIILFGSYSKGEDTSKSDIDIAIITSKSILLGMKKFESVLKRKINLHEIKINNADKSFLNSLSNGIVLYGYLKMI
jgi:predicted nucleotidyltransferase